MVLRNLSGSIAISTCFSVLFNHSRSGNHSLVEASCFCNKVELVHVNLGCLDVQHSVLLHR